MAMASSPQDQDAGSPRAAVCDVLARRRPPRFVYAPNYWQWFAHSRNHGRLPAELAGCASQLDMIAWLGLDVFSRNVYCDQARRWFGGLAEEVWEGVEARAEERTDGRDGFFSRTYRTRAGTLVERQRYVFSESTLVQEKFAVTDPGEELAALEALVAGRSWRFSCERYEEAREQVGDRGIVVAGELFSPLKLLHLMAGPERTTFLLADHPDRVAAILARHEAAQLDLVRQMTAAGVPALMAMDNLDSTFHPPPYVEAYAASFYEQAARLCREAGSTFFIHACGQQRANLRLISSLGVDGLEGVAAPPLGDVELDEAMRMTGDRFLITGGISAMETRGLTTREAVFAYVSRLLDRMKPYAHRFMLAASCNTAIDTPWETIKHFRDAWVAYGGTL
jgi:hypothetical protein